jgi:hypothetical protein
MSRRNDDIENIEDSEELISVTVTPVSIWLDIDGTRICANHIAAYRPIDSDTTAIWTVGQSAIDGNFIVDASADEIDNAIQQGSLQFAAQQRAMESDNQLTDPESFETLSVIMQNRHNLG